MTNRERLLAILDGKPVDRVPIWLLFPYHKAPYYTDVRTNPCYREIFEESKTRALMLNRRNLGVRLFSPEVTSDRREFDENGEHVVRDTLSYRGRTLAAEVRRGTDGSTVRRLLGSEEDLRTWAEFPVNTDPDAIAAELESRLPRYLEERAEFPIEYGAMMLDMGEPIGPVYHSSKLEEYAIWSLVCPDVVQRVLDAHMERLRHVYRWCLERNLADVYFLVGSEMASPPLVSRSTFQRWIVPYARELIDMVHAYGKKVILHYHGQIREILPDFLDMGPDGLHTIEAPPVGNCTFTQAFDIVGDRMALIGNVQYDCFRSHTPEQMEAEVRAILDECRGRRLILSPTAGPYEETIPPRMIENYLMFLRAGWRWGGH